MSKNAFKIVKTTYGDSRVEYKVFDTFLESIKPLGISPVIRSFSDMKDALDYVRERELEILKKTIVLEEIVYP